jgi:hypothetical protein
MQKSTGSINKPCPSLFRVRVMENNELFGNPFYPGSIIEEVALDT